MLSQTSFPLSITGHEAIGIPAYMSRLEFQINRIERALPFIYGHPSKGDQARFSRGWKTLVHFDLPENGFYEIQSCFGRAPRHEYVRVGDGRILNTWNSIPEMILWIASKKLEKYAPEFKPPCFEQGDSTLIEKAEYQRMRYFALGAEKGLPDLLVCQQETDPKFWIGLHPIDYPAERRSFSAAIQ